MTKKTPPETFTIPMTGPDGKPSPEFLAWADGMLRKDPPPKPKRIKKPRRPTRR